MAPIFIVIIFVAVVFAVEGLYFLVLERRADSSTVRRRLRALGSSFQAGGEAREDSILRGEGGASTLGQLLGRSGRLLESTEVLKRGLALAPYDATFYSSLSVNYITRGRYSEANRKSVV